MNGTNLKLSKISLKIILKHTKSILKVEENNVFQSIPGEP